MEKAMSDEKCPQCGAELCPTCFQCITEHNEDPVSSCPGTEGNLRTGTHIPLREADLRRQLAAEKERADERELALQSLTPGGSEFINDPQRCVEHVRGVNSVRHRLLLKYKKRSDEAERERDEALRLRDFDTSTIPLPKGLMLEYGRLDALWQKLVKELDEAMAALTFREQCEEQELAGMAARLDGAPRQADNPEPWLLGWDSQDKELAVLNELTYLREHHDECHQPAGNYALLLDRLKGVKTNHGDCLIAAKMDELEAEITLLQRKCKAEWMKQAGDALEAENERLRLATANAIDEQFKVEHRCGNWYEAWCAAMGTAKPDLPHDLGIWEIGKALLNPEDCTPGRREQLNHEAFD